MEYSLDLFSLFVENVFGNLLFAIIGLVVLLTLICMFGRMSILLTTAIIILFLMSLLVGLFGSVVGIMVFFFTFLYFAWNLIVWIRGKL